MLAFLHVFHHSTTAFLTLVEIKGKVSGVTDDLIEYLAFLLTFSFFIFMHGRSFAPTWQCMS